MLRRGPIANSMLKGRTDIINFHDLRAILTNLSNLTGLPFSVYGEKADIILSPTIEDKFLSLIHGYPKGRDEYHDFLKSCIEKTINRKDISIFKGPLGQYHFFIPVRIEIVVLIITGSVYISSEEFEDFYRREGQSYGLTQEQLQYWSQQITTRDYAVIEETSRHIQSLLNLFLRSSYEGDLSRKKYRLVRAILSLISDIELEKKADKVYDILTDILIFLFNVDSVSVMVKDDNRFRIGKVAGRLKEELQSLSLPIHGILSEAIERQRPVYSEDIMEVLRLGIPEKVTSVYIFPIVLDDKESRLLCIFNSHIPQEDVDIIPELCRIAGFILRVVELYDIYNRRKKDIGILNLVVKRLNEAKEPEMLYETVVDVSANLTEAERCSLMLTENGTPYLTIKAAKGINRKLLKEIKIRVGEGIAGKVFEEGEPLFVSDIERDERILLPKRPSYRTGSFICIPLKTVEGTIGVINLSDKITGEVFSEEDMDLLNSLASYVSIALERSLYYSLAGHLKELSITDSLTGLFNKRYFEERFFEELQRSVRYNLSFSLAMIDIDDFKLFNDTEGHLAGDRVLKSIANIAKENSRAIDIIARFGGEEFAIIMPRTGKDKALLVAERIRQSVKEQLPRVWRAFPKENITITVGVATFPSDGADMKELIRNADKALYRGKMEGKDKTILYKE